MNQNIFEQASRVKGGLLIQTTKGQLSIYDLWNLPLSEGVINLYDIEEKLGQEIRVHSSSRRSASNIDPVVMLKFKIVNHIIETRLSEAKSKQIIEANKAHNEKIDELIAEKKDEKLKKTSIKDLEKLKKEV